jgi:replicative DNA helicase
MLESDHATALLDEARALGAGLLSQLEHIGQIPASERIGTLEESIRALLQEAGDALDALTQQSGAPDAPVCVEDVIGVLASDYGRRRALAAKHAGVVGVRTGMHHLDETLNGLEAGKLYLLAAMPGSGKTTLALQWAAAVAQSGDPALYISLENDAADLVRKLACRMGDVSYTDALKGRLDPIPWQAALAKLSRLNRRLFLCAPRGALPDLPALLDAVQQQAGSVPALVVLDYLQAAVKRGTSRTDAGDVRERIDRFTPELRALAERRQCAVLAIASQNRSGYANGGQASLKESGDLEYNADVVITWMW